MKFSPRLSPRQLAHGFTLIELIMVIVILGVLSAVALPKFLDMRRDARVAKLQGLEATLKTTAHQLRALCYLQYQHCSDQVPFQTAVPGTTEMPRVVSNGDTIGMYYGWPTAWWGYGPTAGYKDITAGLTLTDFTVAPYVPGSFLRDFQITDAQDPTNCKVSYQLWMPNPSGTARFVLSTSGC